MTSSLAKLRSFFPGSWGSLLILLGLYFGSHVLALTILPVFADEAIYIRWSQLIIDDWQRYLFFPLNDGKTPLFIWSLVPFELLIKDPLWAARFLSVLIGFGQVLANSYLVRTLGGKQRAQWLAMILTTLLPFWYFYHRQGLIDSLLTFCSTLLVISTIRLAQAAGHTKFKLLALPSKHQQAWILAVGLTLGLALFTKLPAVLIVPTLPLWVLLPTNKSWAQRFQLLVYLGTGIFIGLLFFATLRISPAFGQLFSRGSDFLFGFSEVLGGKWRETLPSVPTYIGYFMNYSHLFVLIFFVASLFGHHKRRAHLLFWSGILFCLPMALMGKVVYARYFLPGMIFLTAGVSLYLEEIINFHIERGAHFLKKMSVSLVIVIMLANIVASSVGFITYALTDPDNIPFVLSDQVQYLGEWSSGHGIPEVEDFIRLRAQTQTVAVATEGFFGTLPDGLFMYFAANPDPNVKIDGIGQPVTGIPDFFRDSSAGYSKKYLVVNSHRMKMTLPKDKFVFEVCRPHVAPCLQLWDISEF